MIGPWIAAASPAFLATAAAALFGLPGSGESAEEYRVYLPALSNDEPHPGASPTPPGTATPTATATPTRTPTPTPTPTPEDLAPTALDTCKRSVSGTNGSFAQGSATCPGNLKFPVSTPLYAGVYGGVGESVTATVELTYRFVVQGSGRIRVGVAYEFDGYLTSTGLLGGAATDVLIAFEVSTAGSAGAPPKPLSTCRLYPTIVLASRSLQSPSTPTGDHLKSIDAADYVTCDVTKGQALIVVLTAKCHSASAGVFGESQCIFASRSGYSAAKLRWDGIEILYID